MPVLTNVSMMALDTLPEHLIVAGGSYIGLEFAQMYRRFGARVTVLEYGDRLIAREDPEVSRAGAGDPRARRDRLPLRTSRTPASAPAQARAACASCSATRRAAACRRSKAAICSLRSAASPTPTTSASIGPGSRPTGAASSSSTTSCAPASPAIWALGDANGRGAFTHTSFNDHQIVADNLLHGGKRRVSDRLSAYALFIDPPLGRVGMSEAEVRARGKPALVGVMPMTRVGRAKERGETQGFMKVLVDAASERILGASLLCIEGDEIVHSLLDVMAADASYKVVERAVHIHPTVSELIPTLLGQLVPLAPA